MMNNNTLYCTEAGNDIMRSSTEGKYLNIKSIVAELKKQKYSKAEALDVMSAEEESDMHLVTAAVNAIYNPAKPKHTQASNDNGIQKHKLKIVPCKYADIAPYIEYNLKKLGAKQFILKLARSNKPLMPVNDKNLESYIRLAQSAEQDSHYMNALHNDLRKWFEEAMYNSAVKSKDHHMSVTAHKNGNYIVTNGRGSSCEVCLHQGTCTCNEFKESGMADFGLACEHIITTADKVAPEEFLTKIQDL